MHAAKLPRKMATNLPPAPMHAAKLAGKVLLLAEGYPSVPRCPIHVCGPVIIYHVRALLHAAAASPTSPARGLLSPPLTRLTAYTIRPYAASFPQFTACPPPISYIHEAKPSKYEYRARLAINHQIAHLEGEHRSLSTVPLLISDLPSSCRGKRLDPFRGRVGLKT